MVCVLHTTFGIEYIIVVVYSSVATLLREKKYNICLGFFAMLSGLEGRASSGGFLAVCDK